MPASACDLAAAGDLESLRQLPLSALLLPDKNGHTAAHWAAGSGQLPTLEWLIAAGLEADGVGRVSTRSKRRRPLHFAARNGQLEVVRHLCEVASVDPDSRDSQEVSSWPRVCQLERRELLLTLTLTPTLTRSRLSSWRCGRTGSRSRGTWWSGAAWTRSSSTSSPAARSTGWARRPPSAPGPRVWSCSRRRGGCVGTELTSTLCSDRGTRRCTRRAGAGTSPSAAGCGMSAGCSTMRRTAVVTMRRTWRIWAAMLRLRRGCAPRAPARAHARSRYSLPCGAQARCGRPVRPKRLIGRGWPRLAEARGSLKHDLALKTKGASGEPAGRGLSQLVYHLGARPACGHDRPARDTGSLPGPRSPRAPRPLRTTP